jgi:hypothetical protein
MGIHKSFRIEAKCHLCYVFLSKDGARWLAKCVEKNITRGGDPSFLRTYRENDQGFVICRHGNDYGRFVELMVYGKVGVKGRLVIPEGKEQGGLWGFIAELRHVLEPQQKPNNDNVVPPIPEPRFAPADGKNHRNDGHQTWSSMLFPHVENIEKPKWQGRDLRDFCGENGRENFVGFGAKVTETVNAKNEVLLNLKVKLSCNSTGEWKATWVGLDEVGPLTNARGPPPASPPPTTKQVWKPIGPRPTRPAPNKDRVNSFGPHILPNPRSP